MKEKSWEGIPKSETKNTENAIGMEKDVREQEDQSRM